MNSPLRHLPLAALATAVVLSIAPWTTRAAAPGQVRLWETNEVIPTYLAAPPSPIPRFYNGRTYQGAKATFYPYPVQDQLTDIKTNKTYNMVYLENDYIKIGILPEIGGRIFSAVDKSNGYNFFYRQHVIKPALIGMLGAWISGGVEWNIPHHHRASSFMPVEYTTVTNADGSATVWVGETELRHRMRWLVGMKLYPDRSYLELTCKVFNRTPFAQSMLFWINPAVHANTNYQVIFPPSTEWVVQHAKPEFASWPIARQVYGGTDYTRGVDISWWKNHPSPVSFFAWNYEDDWFGGYDHGKQAGVLHVADHNVAPGKKFFEWGNGPEGEMWSKVLTDDDGPYLELMAGAWSDNQPDYSWIQPGETREWQHWWYPIRDMGGVKAANKDVAINLEVTNRTAKLAINTSAKHEKVKVRLEMERNILLEQTISIGPGHPFTASVNLENDVQPDQLTAWFSGQKWTLQKPKGTPMPKAVARPENPKDYIGSDKIYYTGQRIEQLYSPSFDPVPYYQEILRRDPGDYRAATAMGVLLCRQWRWGDAQLYLSAATERATENHVRPKDGEAFYYLGVALRAGLQNPLEATAKTRLEETLNAFQKAAWSVAWRSASYYQLAEIEAQRQEYALALHWITRALELNQQNPQSLNLKSSILRYSGQFDAALDCSAMAQRLDPLDYQSKFESALAEAKFPSKNVAFGQIEPSMLLKKQAAPFSQLPFSINLEMIVNYRNAGFSNEVAFIAQNSAKCALMQALFPKCLSVINS